MLIEEFAEEAVFEQDVMSGGTEDGTDEGCAGGDVICGQIMVKEKIED